VVSLAHPAIDRLSCALLHPEEPSCLKTFLQASLHELFAVSKFMAILYGAIGVIGYRHFAKR
jgi:hypothetical protein